MDIVTPQTRTKVKNALAIALDGEWSDYRRIEALHSLSETISGLLHNFSETTDHPSPDIGNPVRVHLPERLPFLAIVEWKQSARVAGYKYGVRSGDGDTFEVFADEIETIIPDTCLTVGQPAPWSTKIHDAYRLEYEADSYGMFWGKRDDLKGGDYLGMVSQYYLFNPGDVMAAVSAPDSHGRNAHYYYDPLLKIRGPNVRHYMWDGEDFVPVDTGQGHTDWGTMTAVD